MFLTWLIVFCGVASFFSFFFLFLSGVGDASFDFGETFVLKREREEEGASSEERMRNLSSTFNSYQNLLGLYWL